MIEQVFENNYMDMKNIESFLCKYDYKNIKYALPKVADEIRCDALRRFCKKNIRFG